MDCREVGRNGFSGEVRVEGESREVGREHKDLVEKFG